MSWIHQEQTVTEMERQTFSDIEYSSRKRKAGREMSLGIMNDIISPDELPPRAKAFVGSCILFSDSSPDSHILLFRREGWRVMYLRHVLRLTFGARQRMEIRCRSAKALIDLRLCPSMA